MCHYRLGHYEEALSQFQIAESLLKKHEYSQFKRLNQLFINCLVKSQLIDQVLIRYDYLLDYIKRHSKDEFEYLNCMNKKIKLMKAQKNVGNKYTREIKRSIKKKVEYLGSRQASHFFDRPHEVQKQMEELEQIEE